VSSTLTAAVKPGEAPDVVGRVMQGFEQDEKSHRDFRLNADRRYRAYRGILEQRSDAASWTNKQHPPYILQIIETMIASSLDPNPAWQVKARPKMADPSLIAREADGAKAMQILLTEQLDIDHFAEKERPFAMQGYITGLTVLKNYWRYSEGTRKSLSEVQVPVEGSTWLSVPQIQQVEGTHIFHDNPTADIVDVRDFIWHEAATSLERAMRITHRVWYSWDELKQLEAAGVYENVDQLKESQDFSGQLVNREQELFRVNRAKNQIEVLEQWFYEKGEIWVVSVGNRKVCLTPGGKAKPNPFFHGGYPFVVTSSMPDLFRIPGISEVEVIQDLQEMLWTLMNQRLDNLQLLNNAIAIIRSDVDDPDAYEFAPGERWLVDDINQVKFLETPPITAELAVQAEAGLKSDLQNISGGMPMLAGSDSQIDNKTATAASIFTNLAQRRLAAKKQNYTWAYNRMGEQWIELNQQFIREERAIEIVGPDGGSLIKKISPMEIQGRYHIRGEMMDESLNRQERRAEAQAKLQVALSAALPFAQSSTPLNLQAFMDDFLEAFDVQDTSKYYTQKNPLPNMQESQPGAPGGGTGPPPPGGPEGTTAPQAVDVNSPSNAFSQSPVAATQRMGAMSGGPVNQ
jgi:hypothetical protein